MNRRECCAEGLFVRPMQRRARKQKQNSLEDVLLSSEVRGLMKWAGNTPPILTISAMESYHAGFANLLRSKGFARTGTISILLDTLMTKHRNQVPARLLLEIKRLVDQSVEPGKRTRSNQYGTPRHMIGQIHAEVKRTREKLQRQRQKPSESRPHKFGVRLFFEQVKARQVL